MASSQNYLPNSQENEELGLPITTAGKDDKSDPMGNSELRLRRELLLRKELHKSFDLNKISPTPLDSGNPRNFPFEYRNGDQNKVEKRCLIKKDTSKKRPRNVEISCDTKDDGTANSEIDLELRLSSPASARYSSSSRQIIQSENLSSRLSYNLKSKQEGLDFAVSKASKVSSLVLMGCSICYLYVMVPENDPKCPNCESYNMIDVFRGNSRAKRSRN